MDKLPHSLLLDILSRLDDSADVARCRVASKGFNDVFPGLRSINLLYSKEWCCRASINHRIRPFMSVFLDFISKLEAVESICITIHDLPSVPYRINEDSVEWLPRVSGSLKSLSITDLHFHLPRNLLLLISESCHNLVNLRIKFGRFSVDSLNPMPSLTSLTLEHLYLEDEYLNDLNRCFPNLEYLSLYCVVGIEDPKIHLLKLKTCVLVNDYQLMLSLTIIAPNLITLTIVTLQLSNTRAIHIEAPMLSYFQYNGFIHGDAFVLKTLKNLKTLWIDAFHIGIFLSNFPITKTVETLTLNSKRTFEYRDSEFTLGKISTLFPNVTSLCLNSGAWLQLEAWFDRQSCKTVYGRKEPKTTIYQGWDDLDRMKGLKTICAYLKLVDPLLTFSAVACVLDLCVGLSNVSLLIHDDVGGIVSNGFMSKCMARWPGLKWRWGRWSEHKENHWITDGSSIEKKQRSCRG